MKTCCKCKEQKVDTLFSRSGKYRSSTCKVCHAVYSNNHYLKNKEKYRNKANSDRKKRLNHCNLYKSHFGCYVCGEKDSSCLDFHHIDSKKKTDGVAAMIRNYAWQTLLDEIAKCVVICSNCHRKKHYKELQTLEKKSGGQESNLPISAL